MNELKDDSVFVLKMILIIGGFFMAFFSKVGYYILILMFTAGSCALQHFVFKLPFWPLFRNATIINTLIFEIFYPRFDHFTRSTYLEIKVEYDKAKAELKRRRTGVDSDCNRM